MNRRIIPVISAAVMIGISGIACGTAVPDASQAPALVACVTQYKTDYQGGWQEYIRDEYSYDDHGFPQEVVRYEYGERSFSHTFEYAYEDGLPVSMKQYDQDGILVSETTYKAGNVYEVNSADTMSTTRELYQYGLGGEYFTTYLRDFRQSIPENPDENMYMEEIDSVSVVAEDGKLVRTVNSGLYANTGTGEEKEWMRFNGTYGAQYEDGIVVSTSSVFRAGPPGSEYLFDFTKENGKITEAVRKTQLSEQDPKDDLKVVFEYTGIEMDYGRYTRMINAFLLGPSSNYYIFNWY